MKHKVAVITRTKDRPVFLMRALDSVRHQKYQDYVHVIVNDGGDASEVDRIVNGQPESYKQKIQVFHRTNPSNAPDTIFNESIDRVSSDYFAIHDDDDTWHEEFLTRTVGHLDATPDIGAVVVRTDKVTEEVVGQELRQLTADSWMADMSVISIYRQCVDNQFTPISSLFRRSAYESVGKFDETLPVVGDWEFGIRLLLGYDADFIDPGFALAKYHHRKSADNSFASHNHRYYFNKVANKYLRQELASGDLGVGYIISKTRYEQSYVARTMTRLLPSFVARKLKKRVH